MSYCIYLTFSNTHSCLDKMATFLQITFFFKLIFLHENSILIQAASIFLIHKHANIGLNNGLAPVCCQAIISTINGLVSWHIYKSYTCTKWDVYFMKFCDTLVFDFCRAIKFGAGNKHTTVYK